MDDTSNPGSGYIDPLIGWIDELRVTKGDNPHTPLLARADDGTALLARAVIAKALAEHEQLDVGWQCYLGAADAVIAGLKSNGVMLATNSTNSRAEYTRL